MMPKWPFRPDLPPPPYHHRENNPCWAEPAAEASGSPQRPLCPQTQVGGWQLSGLSLPLSGAWSGRLAGGPFGSKVTQANHLPSPERPASAGTPLTFRL